jgi:hypothetical protein
MLTFWRSKMDGLMIDTPDSGIVTMEQAFAIQPKAKATKTYQPVPNKALWEKTAESRGLQLGIPQMGLARKGQRLFGSVEITNQDHLDGDVRLMLGFRNSGDKSMSIGVCFGSKVFVCSNMCFTGYTSDEEDAVGQVHHRHSTNVWDGLQERLDAAMDKFTVFKSYQDDFYSRLKNIKLRDVQAHDMIIRAARAEAITAKDCFNVAEHWAYQAHCPEHEADNWHKEFMPRNAWSLFNCFTEIHKGIQSKNPVDANLRSIKMNRFFHQQFMTN